MNKNIMSSFLKQFKKDLEELNNSPTTVELKPTFENFILWCEGDLSQLFKEKSVDCRVVYNESKLYNKGYKNEEKKEGK
jgi:hypothetical protein